MSGQIVDLVLLLGAGAFFVGGYRQGLLVGLLSFLGLIGGGLLGAKLAPLVASDLLPDQPPAMVGLVLVVLAAAAGQILAAGVGVALRDRVTWEPVQALDAVGGGFLSAAALLVVAWLVGTALVASPYRGAANAVRSSGVLAVVDGTLPTMATQQLAAFRSLVDTSGFPQVVEAFSNQTPAEVAPPDPALQAIPGVTQAEPAVVRVTGTAPSCGEELTGTGFVYAPERVMTNAHVVAGVRAPAVHVGGETLEATVVAYDPDDDLAVLHVPGLDVTPLPFAEEAPGGADAVVVGYPAGGPFTASPARVRRVLPITGPDIYHRGEVTREVYELRVVVQPGNSGGPLLSPSGSVHGVVFAASRDDSETGYALTGDEVAPLAEAGRSATEAVSTQGCA